MEQLDLLRYVIESLERLDLKYAVVGSFASGAYGEPRFTQDIDIVVDLRSGQITDFCRCFPGPEFYLSEPAVRDAVQRKRQFNVIHPTSGNKVDFMLERADPWGRNQLARRQATQIFPDRIAYLASPEDVILGKMLYYGEGGSEKHLRDITGILRVNGDQVDRHYVADFAEQLGVSEIWKAVLNRLEG